jgi:hypothetical protein
MLVILVSLFEIATSRIASREILLGDLVFSGNDQQDDTY